MQLTSTKIW